MQVENSNSSSNLDQDLDPRELPQVAVLADKPRKFPWGFVKNFGVLAVVGTSGVLFLPSFLTSMSCVNLGKQTEAKLNLQRINRTQQAKFVENNSFANSLATIDISLKNQTLNYNYSIQTTKTAALHYAIARQPALKNYVAAVFVLPTTKNKSELKTVNILCETLRPMTTLAAPTVVKGIPTCNAGTNQLTLNYK